MVLAMQRKNEEYYDTNDPFIDDSELALDQRQYFAQTKQKGFYVSSGEIPLMKDKLRSLRSPPFPLPHTHRPARQDAEEATIEESA